MVRCVNSDVCHVCVRKFISNIAAVKRPNAHDILTRNWYQKLVTENWYQKQTIVRIKQNKFLNLIIFQFIITKNLNNVE